MKKPFSSVLGLLLIWGFGLEAFAETVVAWTWLSGSSDGRGTSVYGTKGVPDISNVPGARSGSALWVVPYPFGQDEASSDYAILYLFGGYGTDEPHVMWKFNTSSLYWTWIGGNRTYDASSYVNVSSYNEYSSSYFPRPFAGMASFTYNSTLLYLFGGSSEVGIHDDLWKFNVELEQWALVIGSQGLYTPPVYGPLGEYSSSYSPGNRQFSVGFSPVNGIFYIFGGFGAYELVNGATDASHYNDVWALDLEKLKWAWIAGLSALWVESTSNYPGWGSSLTHYGAFSPQDPDTLYLIENDRWKFHISNASWTLLGSTPSARSSPTTKGTFNASNSPGRRILAGTGVILTGNFVLFNGLNERGISELDMWEYDPFLDQWAWISGYSDSLDGVYGTKTVRSESNFPGPGGEYSIATFFDETYVFGGTYSNVLWKFEIQACDAGKYFSKELRSCTDCSSGRYRRAGFSCNECEAGYFTESTTSCEPCSSGFYSPGKGSSQCSSCIPGRFSNPASSECSLCPIGTYTNETGLSSCLSCPDGFTSMNIASSSLFDCVCPRGFWGEIARGCSECPDEGCLCDELNRTLPYVLPDFYFKYPNNQVTRCTPKGACKETGYLLETICGEGYTGDLCAQCVPYVYYRKDDKCVKCPGKWQVPVIIVFLLTVFVVVSYFLMKSSGTVPSEVKIVLNSLQVMSLYPSLSGKWPDTLKDFFKALSISNLNIDIISPECSIPMNFLTKTVLKLFAPLVIAGMLGLLYKALSCFSVEQVKDRKDRNKKVLAFIVLLLSVFFTSIASATVSVFNCYTFGDRIISSYDPSVECFSSEWFSYLPVILCFAFLYLGVFPSYVCYSFWIYRKNLENSDFLQIFSTQIAPFKPQYFYWEAFLIFRKTAFVLSAEFLTFGQDRTTKAFVSLLFLFAFFSVETKVSPYKSDIQQQFSFDWSVVSILTLMSVLYFDVDTATEYNKNAFAAIIITIITVCIAHFIWRLWKVLESSDRIPGFLLRKKHRERVGTNIEKTSNQEELEAGDLRSIPGAPATTE